MKKQKHYTSLEEVNNEIKEDILSFNFDDIDLNIDLDLESIDLIDFNFDDLDLDFETLTVSEYSTKQNSPWSFSTKRSWFLSSSTVRDFS